MGVFVGFCACDDDLDAFSSLASVERSFERS